MEPPPSLPTPGGCHSGPNRRRLAAARAAGCACQVPWAVGAAVKQVVGLPCHEKLGGVVTPRTIAPAFLRGATSGGVVAWDEAGAQARSGLAAQTDHVDRLLMLIRTPCSGPRAFRLMTAASASRAVRRVRFASPCT